MFILKNSIPSLFVLAIIFATGCGKKTTEIAPLMGDYITRSYSDGPARSNAVGFTINGKGYIATGVSGKDKLKDLWQFDPEQNTWTQKQNFPGEGRYEAAGFSIENKGYVGIGRNDIKYFNDFYQYNADTDKWDSIAAFPVPGRSSTVAFSLKNEGYVGTGYDGNEYYKNFYKFTPTSGGGKGSWSANPITSLTRDKRTDAVAFTIGEKAYVGLGTNSGKYVNEFLEYDPTTNLWTEIAFPYIKDGSDARDFQRYGAVAFTVNGKGYVTTGFYNNLENSTWEYNPENNSWTKKSSFEASSRTDAVGLSINNRGFVVGGKNGNIKLYDCYEFLPDNSLVGGN